MLAELITFTQQVGFPIVVSLYTLVRLENTITGNTKAISGLAVAIATCPAKQIIQPTTKPTTLENVKAAVGNSVPETNI